MSETRERAASKTPASQLATYEYSTVRIPRAISQRDACEFLTYKAESDRWELDRAVVYEGGEQRVRLKRRIIRVARTS